MRRWQRLNLHAGYFKRQFRLPQPTVVIPRSAIASTWKASLAHPKRVKVELDISTIDQKIQVPFLSYNTWEDAVYRSSNFVETRPNSNSMKAQCHRSKQVRSILSLAILDQQIKQPLLLCFTSHFIRLSQYLKRIFLQVQTVNYVFCITPDQCLKVHSRSP